MERALNAVTDLGNFIRDQRKNARLSLRKLSGMAGISNPYLSQIERGLRRPSAEILQAIARSLRISAETLYVKAGILEERGDDVDPVTAILRDLTINEKQKQVLIEIYQSFRHENELEGAGNAGRVAQARARHDQVPSQPKPAATSVRTAAARKPTARKKAAAAAARGKGAAARKPAGRAAAARKAKTKKTAKAARSRPARGVKASPSRKKTARARTRARPR